MRKVDRLEVQAPIGGTNVKIAVWRAQVGRVLEKELNALNRGTSGREANRHRQEKRLIVLDVEVLSGDQADKVRRRYGGAEIQGVLGVHHVRQLPQQRAEVCGRLLPCADRGIQLRGRRGDTLAGLLVRGFVAFVVVFKQLPGHDVQGISYRAFQRGENLVGGKFLDEPRAKIKQPGGGDVAALALLTVPMAWALRPAFRSTPAPSA